MATQDSPQAEPAAAQCTVVADRFLRIAGTRRIEAAIRPKQRADEPPVQLDDADQDRAHRWDILARSVVTLAASSARDAFPAAGFAFTTTSTGGSSC
jgi:hypothetical protein